VRHPNPPLLGPSLPQCTLTESQKVRHPKAQAASPQLLRLTACSSLSRLQVPPGGGGPRGHGALCVAAQAPPGPGLQRHHIPTRVRRSGLLCRPRPRRGRGQGGGGEKPRGWGPSGETMGSGRHAALTRRARQDRERAEGREGGGGGGEEGRTPRVSKAPSGRQWLPRGSSSWALGLQPR